LTERGDWSSLQNMNHANNLRLVFWETTAGCNLECAHCRRLDVSQTLSQEDLDTAQARRMIDEIAAFAKPILVLSGGEPLMRPDIFELSSHAVAQGLPVALATNGTMIDEPTADRIASSGIRRVSISFDGAKAATHDAFRKQNGSFEAALAGLRRLRARGVSVQINTTVTRHNVDELEAIYHLALREGAEALHLFMLVPVGCGLEIAEEQMLSAERYEAVLNWLYDISKEGRIQTKATCAPHYFRIMRQRQKEEREAGQASSQTDQTSHTGLTQAPAGHPMHAATKGCLAGSGVCFVSHKGEVFPCGYLPVHCGDVTRQNFREIWEKSEAFLRLRDASQLEGKCGLCEYRFVCEGCRARAYAATGNFMSEEPFCAYEPNQAQPRRTPS
jgi:AdoMet-dependent heme synthase